MAVAKPPFSLTTPSEGDDPHLPHHTLRDLPNQAESREVAA